MSAPPITWGNTLRIAIAIAAALGALALIKLIARPLGLLIIAITVAEALAPLVNLLQRWMRRALAITVVILGLAIGVALIGWLVVPTLVAQAQQLIQHAPGMISDVQQWLQRHGSVSKLATTSSSSLMQYVVTLPRQLFGMVTDLLVVIFLAIYWLAGVPGLARFTESLLPPARREASMKVVHDMGQAMGGYVRGAAINAVVMAVLATVALFIIGVDYPVALGVITGLGEPFPYVGPFVAAVPVVLVALVQSPTKALIALGLYCFLQEFEGHVLTPNIMQRQTSMPQTVVILAIVIGAGLAGLFGIIVAIPSVAALYVFTIEVIAPAVRRATGAAAG